MDEAEGLVQLHQEQQQKRKEGEGVCRVAYACTKETNIEIEYIAESLSDIFRIFSSQSQHFLRF
jgi:hypothetical protein